MQLIAEMSAVRTFGPAPPAIVMDAARGHKLMMGVLICGGNIIAACSGNNDNFQPFIQAANRKGYTIARYRNPPYQTRAGALITAAELAASHGGGNTPQPGRCAAPKMINKTLYAHPSHRHSESHRAAGCSEHQLLPDDCE